jgi:hypothetical protein
MAKTRHLTEYADNRGVALRVDREANVIKGVKVLGLDSKNGRSYTREAVSQAAALYEGKTVNVDHPPRGKGNEARSYASRIGHLEGIEVKADGLYGDLHYNPKHSLAEQLAYDAENAPQRVGMSHNVEGKTSTKNGKLVVEAITAVASVDVVADPATTNSLYEAEGDMPDTTTTEPSGSGDMTWDNFVSASRKIYDSDADAGSKGRMIGKLMAELLKMGDKLDQLMNGGSSSSSPSAPKGDSDKPADDAPKTEALEIKVKHLEEQLAARDKRDAVAKMITEAKLPERLVTDVLTTSLLEAKDESAQKKILEERKTLAKEIAGKPRCVDQHGRSDSRQVTEAVVRKSLLEAIG